MTNVQGMTKGDNIAAAEIRHSSFGINSSFVTGLPRRSRAKAGHSSSRHAFTLIELIVVVGIIIVLTGLVLSTAGYARKKSARARAETEIAAISAACENYKADNATYIRGPSAAMTVGNTTIPMNATDVVDAKRNGNPNNPSFGNASLYLYVLLSGDSDGDPRTLPSSKSYFTFKPQMLSMDSNGFVTTIKDPFGNSYGYSTINQTDSTKGYNPTFDLWSTAGLTNDPPTSGTDTITPQWIRNW